jgi:predicted nucleic acid-binding protein
VLTDSSTLVKFYSKEPGWELVEEKLGQSVTIPLALVELGGAFLKKCKNGQLTAERAEQLVKDCSERVVLVNQNKYVANAFQIAMASNLSLYDSLFISAALGEKHDLLSSDEKQLKIAKRFGLKVVEG